MGIDRVVAELAALSGESFGLTADRAQKRQSELKEKKDDLRAQQEAVDARLNEVDLHLSREEAKKNWYRGDVHGFLFGSEDLETLADQQKLSIRANELEARLEIVRKDIARVGQSLSKSAKLSSDLEQTIDGAVDTERGSTRDGAEIGAAAKTDGVAEVQAEADQAAAQTGAVGRKIGDRAEVQVEQNLLRATELREQAARNEQKRSIFGQVIKTLGGGLFSQAGQLLRKIGLPAELGILAGHPKALGTLFHMGLAAGPNIKMVNDNLNLQVQADATELQQSSAQQVVAKMERLSERAEEAHDDSRQLGQQLRENLRKAQFG